MKVNAAAEVIYDLVDPSANLIFGAVIDQSLSGQVSQPPRLSALRSGDLLARSPFILHSFYFSGCVCHKSTNPTADLLPLYAMMASELIGLSCSGR